MSLRESPACASASSRARSAPAAAPAPVGRMDCAMMFLSRSMITTSVDVEPLSMPA